MASSPNGRPLLGLAHSLQELPKHAQPALTGSCACGKVRYASQCLPFVVNHCHCSQCRKLHGAAFATYADFAAKDVVWLQQGSLREVSLSDMAVRGFCGDCGSTLCMFYHCDPDNIAVAAGTIDDASLREPLPKPSVHLFAEEGASWYSIQDDLPRTAQFSLGFQEKMDAWRRAGQVQ